MWFLTRGELLRFNIDVLMVTLKAFASGLVKVIRVWVSSWQTTCQFDIFSLQNGHRFGHIKGDVLVRVLINEKHLPRVDALLLDDVLRFYIVLLLDSFWYSGHILQGVQVAFISDRDCLSLKCKWPSLAWNSLLGCFRVMVRYLLERILLCFRRGAVQDLNYFGFFFLLLRAFE